MVRQHVKGVGGGVASERPRLVSASESGGATSFLVTN